MLWRRRKLSDTGHVPKRKRRWGRRAGYFFLVVLVVLLIGRAILPIAVKWYVNRTISRSPVFIGKIGDVDIHLWRGAYTINNISLSKTTGNVPVPLFAAKELDLSIQWSALIKGRLVGEVTMNEPQLNFVDAPDDSSSQSGAGGPWMDMLGDLFPFKINRADLHSGSIHFRAYQASPPVDVYLGHLEASIENLSNIQNDTTPLMATVTAHAMAMDSAQLDYQMKFDPTSYRPTFQMAVKLIGLDVTKINDLGRAYGKFDFERGWFDLVIEINAQAGGLDGYVKPLFRNLRIISWQDVKEDNILGVFWEALVGGTTQVLSNPPRDQFGTIIPLSGDLTQPNADILTTIGNILRNAFVRAYLPKLQGKAPDIDGLQFGTGTALDMDAINNDQNKDGKK